MAMKTKDEFRCLIKDSRMRLGDADKQQMDAQITERLSKFHLLKSASIVYCYASLPHEVETFQIMHLLWERNITVAVPRVCRKEMDFYIISSTGDLRIGYMGILEPSEGCDMAVAPKSLIIVPGLAYDREGHRIGYGGGYYDRFFEKEPDHIKIGVAYNFQIFPEIPSNEHDKMIDYIITPKKVLGGGMEIESD